MSKIAADFGIHDALKKLGIKDVNEGTSTGSNNFSSGDIISSYSPVDGVQLPLLLKNGEQNRHRYVVKL